MKRKSLRAALGASSAALAAVLSASCGPTVPARGWWRDSVVYEVFVRSFADSNADGIGDLAALTAHLDDLNDGNPDTHTDLGVDALWLMPIYPSPSYHGYDITDYQNVNGHYGTLADFDALVKAAHQRGIKIILDTVLNHTSSQHPWFRDSQSGANAAHRDWYNWSDTDLGWKSQSGGQTWFSQNGSYYYGYFGGGMPDLNFRTQAVQDELINSMKFWLSHGVDGFRLDAVRYFYESATGQVADQPETHQFLNTLRTKLQAVNPNVMLVSEAWANTDIEATYAGDTQLVFAFDQADAIKASAKSGDASNIINQLARANTVFATAKKDRVLEAPFLSNHDQARVMRTLAGDMGAMRAAAATLFAMPGTPFVYYGEELGMQGGAGSDDKDKRTPYRWDTSVNGGFSTGSPWYSANEAAGVDLADERGDANSLFNLYRRLIDVRHSQAGLRGNDATWIQATGGGTGVMALERTDGSAKTLFVVNYAAEDSGSFTVPVDGLADGSPAVADSEGLDGSPTAAGGTLTVPGLAPHGFAFITLQ